MDIHTWISVYAFPYLDIHIWILSCAGIINQRHRFWQPPLWLAMIEKIPSLKSYDSLLKCPKNGKTHPLYDKWLWCRFPQVLKGLFCGNAIFWMFWKDFQRRPILANSVEFHGIALERHCNIAQNVSVEISDFWDMWSDRIVAKEGPEVASRELVTCGM